MGRRNRPFFRLNAVESRTPRGGRIIEKLGHYDPIEKDIAKQLVLNKERIQYWLDKGAIPSDTVSQILLRQGIKTKYAKERRARRAKALALARKKGLPFNKVEKAALQKQAGPPSGVQAPSTEKKAEAAPKAEPKAEAKAESKAEGKTESKVEDKPEDKKE
jgi:small subunit ribosomal protein S16